MLQIMCFVSSEDYWNLDSMKEKNIPVNFYGYTFEVEGMGETSGGSNVVKITVVELLNANMTIGFVLPKGMSIDGEFQLGFICQDNPANEIPLICKLSQEVKRTTYKGDDNERLEYVGFSLERFYESKGVTFYFYDLRGGGGSS